jgi:sec-independent protein translocase protein TatC
MPGCVPAGEQAVADTLTDQARTVSTVNPDVVPVDAGEIAPIDDGDAGVMTLREHLFELRDRLVKAVLGLLLGFMIGTALANPALDYLARQTCPPGEVDCRLTVIDPTEGIVTFIKVSLYIGVALSLPIIAYQLIRFMAPGLTRQEKRLLYSALPFVAVLFVAGSAFAVFLVLPAMLGFLRSFMDMVFRNDFRAAATVSMSLTMMLWMGLVFQLPLVMLILAKLRVIHWQRMLSWWRYAVLGIMVASAIITPTPDPVNMLIVAVPMMVLYALGIVLARIFASGQPSVLPTSLPA